MNDSNTKSPDKSDVKLLGEADSLDQLEMLVETEDPARRGSINSATYQTGATNSASNNIAEHKPLISSTSPLDRKDELPLRASNPQFQPFGTAERSQVAPVIQDDGPFHLDIKNVKARNSKGTRRPSVFRE